MTFVSPVLFIASLTLDEGNEPIHLPLHAGLLDPRAGLHLGLPAAGHMASAETSFAWIWKKYVGMLAFSKQKLIFHWLGQ